MAEALNIVLNVPNTLTAIRFLLSIVVFVLIPLEQYFAAMIVFIIAASTDWIDGWWARKYNQVTKLGRIFDPYYRAKFSDTLTRRGAGLGLTLVQQIAESHGGRVEVDSQPGAGSTFRLLFPRHLSDESRAVSGLVQSKPLPS